MPRRIQPATPELRAVERYLTTARRVGCPQEQAVNFLRAGVVLQEQQLKASSAARLCDLPGGPTKVGYGGARGGGKSHWMLAQMAVDDCMRFPGLKCLLLRKVGKALKEQFTDLLRRAVGGIPYRYTDGLLRLENGSQIVLGHFQKESDVDAYLGLEYDVIGIEEATTLSSTKHRAIESCNRTSKPGWRPRMYETTNPGNLGHAWFKALFVAPYKAKRETITRFVPATVDDNAFVNVEYRDILDRLTGWQLRAWRYGDWDIAAGQFFTNFRAEIDGRPHHVIPPFEIPRAWRKWGALDYGFTHYTTFYLLTENDGNVYAVAEHAERNWLVQRHAPAIRSMLARHNTRVEDLDTIVAGRDVRRKLGVGDPDDESQVHTIKDAYEAEGISLRIANDDRINGAGEILRRLGDADSEPPIAPTLFIFETCPRLIECLPALQHDPHEPEKVLKWDTDDDGLGGDDPYDGFRYGVMEASSGNGWADVAERLDQAAVSDYAATSVW